MQTATARLSVALLTVPLVLSTLAAPASAQFSDAAYFPGPDEVHDRLDKLSEDPWITVHQVGESNEGHPIRVAEIVDPNGSMPVDQRPVTLLITQQHGNEPAGTPAALQLLENITAREEIATTLDDQVLLVLPMVNPDGAEANTRGNANGTDINRDHIGLDTPEAKALHETLNRWEVDVANDHHEYGGTGPGNPVPVRTYDYDLLTLYPRHGNVRAPTLDAAKDLMYDGIWPAAEDAGYSVNEYGEVTADGEPVDEIAGGPDPGILRNHLGLHNIASLLIESRIDMHPNPENPPQRRVDVNRVVMDATLEFVHEHPERFTKAKNASRELAVELPADEYVEGEKRSPLARAYQLPDSAELVDTMTRHGIDPGVPNEDGYVHDTVHPLQGHAAAIFHPDSSRTVVAGEPTELPSPDEAVDPTSGDANGVPVGIGPLAVALAGALVLLGRRRGS